MFAEERMMFRSNECGEAFLKLKDYLSNPHAISKPTLDAPIQLYFSVD